ncbi:MAG: SDR family oxidoreductase [Edaphobacter sp.]|uniref:SDR family NAD(P)-dependent oxidoreductase n=1 Tax=Edaphobacter sp. TaxID=1934404 RepID=UPI00238DED72|nr:SDR family oxidoreductase [Edaphobacter sp.]MDE1178284.1 SDR family oxidoreductase [Edaphobacter sp.]
MSDLQGKNVVIIGGTSGFGRRVAELALESGATVAVGGRNLQRLNEVLSELSSKGGEIRGHVVQATDAASLQDFFEKAGRIDHLVSTVGGAMGGGFSTSDIATIHETFEHKVFDNLRVIRVAHPFLNDGSSITLTGGTGGRPHTASGAILGNAGILTMAQGLAVELAPRTRVNVVAPTWTETPFWRDTPLEQRQSTKAYFNNLIPLGRTATIDEVAEAYLFLIKNTFVTGQQIAVDGGVGLVG